MKAWSFVKRNAIHKCMKTLWIEEKEGIKLHPTCAYTPKTDEVSKNDMVYQKTQQSHPQYYFNNLGLVHLKLKKYNLAIYYLSKAVKFLERSNNKQLANSGISKLTKINPNESLNNTSS